MKRIKMLSQFFEITCFLVLLGLPLLTALAWWQAPESINFLAHIFEYHVIPKGYHVNHLLSTKERLLGFVVSAVPMMINMLMIACLMKLFARFKKGEVFSNYNVILISRAAVLMFISEVLQPFYQVAVGFVVMINNPAHERYVQITFKQENVEIILIALVILLGSWIMKEAYALSEEQRLTV